MLSAYQLPLLLSVLASHTSGPSVDVGAGLVTQTAAGSLSIRPNEPSQPAAEFSVQLLSGLRVVSRRTQFRFGYVPRLYLQIPNIADSYQPLLLHRVLSDYTTALSQRTSLQASADFGAGDLNYAASQEFFADGTSAPLAGLVPVLSLGGGTSLSHALSRSNSLELGVRGGYRSSFASTLDDPSVGTLPTSFDVNVFAGDQHQLSERDQLGFRLTGGYFALVQGQGENATRSGTTLAPQLRYDRKLGPRSDAGLFVGSTLSLGAGQAAQIFPTLGTAYQTRLQTPGATYQASFEGGVRGFLDQIRVAFVPQAYAQGQLQASWHQDWSAGLQLFGSTVIIEEPVTPPAYETIASLRIPFSYRVSPGLGLNFGAAATYRGPHLSAPGSLVEQQDVTGFINLRWTRATDDSQGQWLLQ